MRMFIGLLVSVGLMSIGYYDHLNSIEPLHNMTEEMMLQICIEEGIPL